MERRESVWLRLIVLALVAARIAYHAEWLAESPFAIGTVSDGAMYETAARDILAHPPFGKSEFWLQGAYAYFIALCMLIEPWVTLAIVGQLVCAGLGLWLFHRSACAVFGRRAGWASTALLLAYPGLSFYENKLLTAELGVVSDIAIIAASIAHARTGRGWAAALVGGAAGLAMLFRPNLALALPFLAYALVIGARAHLRSPMLALGWAILGLVTVTAPLAIRNASVTGRAEIWPAHGGGMPFWIGNNPDANGLWNSAGGFSASVGAEVHEISTLLGDQMGGKEAAPDRLGTMGDLMYGRAFEWIKGDPFVWIGLEVKKAWLMSGNDELTQDFDWLGEREAVPWAHRIGIPFAWLLGLGLVGAAVGHRRDPVFRSSTLAVLGIGIATVAANLIFFTSAQHRLPLCVVGAWFAGEGLVAALDRARRPSPWVWGAALVVALQGSWSRTHRTGPHPVHHYNVAIAHLDVGLPALAIEALDRAVEGDPDHPVFRLQRGRVRLQLGDLSGSASDFRQVLAHSTLEWLTESARIELASVEQMSAAE